MDKEKYRKEAKDSIDKLFAQIEELESKKDRVKDEARKEIEEILDNLKVKKAQLETKYEELVDSSEDRWEEAKEAFSSAADSFKEGFGKIASLFK